MRSRVLDHYRITPFHTVSLKLFGCTAPRWLLEGVSEGRRRVGRDVEDLTGSHCQPLAAEGGLDLDLEDGEHLLEVVAVGSRAAALRDLHIDEAVAASGIFAFQKDRVGVSHHPEVGQVLVCVGAREHETLLGSSGGIVGAGREEVPELSVILLLLLLLVFTCVCWPEPVRSVTGPDVITY
jgi:hypothetical protein